MKPRRCTHLGLRTEPRSFPLSSALSFLSWKVKKVLPNPARKALSDAANVTERLRWCLVSWHAAHQGHGTLCSSCPLPLRAGMTRDE